jgi:transposase
MARPVSGVEHVEAARQLLKTAKSAQELRAAQAVLLPLELGLNMHQTALLIGRSVGVTCTLRTRFAAILQGRRPPPRGKHDLRNRAKFSLQQEARVLDEVLSGADQGQILVIPQLKPLIEKRLGKSMALSSVYRMLARHGWRKLAPDTHHPQGDPQAREDWKKNAPAHWRKFETALNAKHR